MDYKSALVRVEKRVDYAIAHADEWGWQQAGTNISNAILEENDAIDGKLVREYPELEELALDVKILSNRSLRKEDSNAIFRKWAIIKNKYL